MKIMKWINRIFLGICTLVLFGGISYERISRINASNNIKPTGELVDVGGHQLHVVKKGTGGPTVIFEAGLGGSHLTWNYIQDKISKLTTTISYDRSGILWSERGDNPKTSAAMASELYALLESTKCPKPYIVVGHSFAGVTLRKFISQHRNDISGIVFVDASHPDQMRRLPDQIKQF